MSCDIYYISENAGLALARRYGTSLRSHWEFNYTGDAAKYSGYKLQLSEMVTTYGEINQSISERYANSFEQSNGSSVEQQYNFVMRNTYADTFSWSVNEELKVGTEVKGKAGIPFLAEGEVTSSVELTLSSNQTKTKTHTEEFETQVSIKVPSHTTIYGDIFIEVGSGYIPFTSKGQISGCCAYWFHDKIALNNDGDKHWLWFIPISTVLQINLDNNCYITGFGWNSDGSCYGEAKGVLNFSLGYKAISKIHEKPYQDLKSKYKVNISSTPKIFYYGD